MDEDTIMLLIFGFLVLSIMVAGMIDCNPLPAIHFSATSIALGVMFGGTMHLLYPSSDWSEVQFGDRILFRAVLPTIAFATGFSLDVKTFLMNLKTIFAIGLVGTLINWVGLSFSAIWLRDLEVSRDYSDLECLLLSAILSSYDPVAVIAVLQPEASPMFHSLVSGEGMLSGVVSIALTESVAHVANNNTDHSLSWDAVGELAVRFARVLLVSVSLGIAVGLLSALCVKWLRNRSPTDVENSYIYLWGIIAYFAAEVADSSGVVSVFFCGMTMSQYTIRNISDAALLTSFHSLNSLSYSLQACLFTVIGFFGWSYLSSCYVFRPIDGHTVDVYSAAGMLAAIMAARGIIVPMFLYFCNRKKNSSERVGWRQQLAVWFSGLIRGLVSFWLSHSVTMVSPEADGIVTTTFIVVVFTTIVCGCLAKTMFSCFGVPTCAEEAAAMRSVEGSPPILPPTGTEEYTELGASDVDMSEMHGNRRSTLCHFRCSARSVPSVITGRPRASPVTEYFMDLNPSKLQTAIKKFDSRVMQPLFGESTTSVPHYVAAADSSQMGMSTEQTSLLSFPRVPQQTVNPFSSEAARAGTG
eukprot:TRINITY_DN8086_c0_g1_i2.p1 TRINITY_DN8086_c0_g1~~TRINITY_DN8086_c0_g1_i2.p1  ORF type:complete len:583 (+),score=64.91 TRINITY_DN8086_c0_g1_i2:90-1838(+)